MNPLIMAYANDAHLRAEQYAGTTAAFVLGRANCIRAEWDRVRDRGSEIYKYVLPIERPNTRVSAIDEEIYMGDSSRVPLWPYLDANGQQRFQEGQDAKLADIRVGSQFVTYLVDYLASQIRLKRYTGFFLDGFGGQLWGAAGWTTWPLGERQEWQAGAIDLARRLDEMRRAEDPSAIFQGNNTWEYAPAGEQYMDGCCIENAKITNAAAKRLAGNPYSNLGHRRVFTISRTKADALAWAAVPGVTHVCNTEENLAAKRGPYSYPTTPVVGYSRLGDSDAALRAQLARALNERDALDRAVRIRDEAIASLQTDITGLNSQLDDLNETVAREKQKIVLAARALGYGS